MVTYRTTGEWGAGKGSNLTSAEVDANFHELDQALQAALAAIPATAGVADIVHADGALTFLLTDGSTFGPFALPVTLLRWRGTFQGGRAYRALDAFFVPSVGGFIVTQDHTSAASFNPSSTDYVQIFSLIPGGFRTVWNRDAWPDYTLQLADAKAFVRVSLAEPPTETETATPVTETETATPVTETETATPVTETETATEPTSEDGTDPELSISKFTEYTVLSEELSTRVSKFIEYIILEEE